MVRDVVRFSSTEEKKQRGSMKLVRLTLKVTSMDLELVHQEDKTYI